MLYYFTLLNRVWQSTVNGMRVRCLIFKVLNTTILSKVLLGHLVLLSKPGSS